MLMGYSVGLRLIKGDDRHRWNDRCEHPRGQAGRNPTTVVAMPRQSRRIPMLMECVRMAAMARMVDASASAWDEKNPQAVSHC